MNRLLAMLFMTCACCVAQAQSYYVDATNGSDVWTGTSTSCAGCDPQTANPGPWRTVSKVNGSIYQPGDAVLFLCGGVWRETLVIPGSGTAASPLTIGSYPTDCSAVGAKPLLTGSLAVTGWTQYSDKIYVANANFTNPPRNLLTNGGLDFEIAPWFLISSGGSLTHDVSDANGNAGSGSMKFTSGSVSTDHVGSNVFAIGAGNTYHLSFKIRADVGNTVSNVNARFAETPWVWSCSFAPITADGTWRQYETDCTVPDNANALLYVFLPPSSSTQNNTVYLDDLSVVQTIPSYNPAPAQQVFVDGQYIKLAHYPNKGYLSTKPNSVFLTIADNSTAQNYLTAGTDLSLSPTQDIVGAGIHIRTVAWDLEDRTVTSFDPLTFKISWLDDTNSAIKKNWGYYLDNKLWMLDEPGEWYYENDPNKPDYQNLYIWLPDSSNPTAHDIEASVRDQAVYASSRTDFVVDGLKITNAGKNGADISMPMDFTLRNLDIQSSGENGIKATGDYAVYPAATRRIENSSISNSVRQGIQILNMSNVTIYNNTVNNSGTVGSPVKSLAAINASGTANSLTITNNRITSAGYLGINFSKDTLVQNNVVQETCLVLDDCGAIYTWNGLTSSYYDSTGNAIATPPSLNSHVMGNIIIDAIGGSDGSPNTGTSSEGVYLDNFTNGVEVANNVVVNADRGMYMNNPRNNNAHNNTVFGARIAQLQMNEAFGAPSGAVTNNAISANTLFPQNFGPSISLFTDNASTSQFGSFTGNLYSSLYSLRIAQSQTADVLNPLTSYLFPQWQQIGNDLAGSNYTLLGVAPYRITGILSGNIITNGNFDTSTDLTKWHQYSSGDTSSTALVLVGAPDCPYGQCAELTSPLTTGQTQLYYSNFQITQGNTYLVKLDIRGSEDNLKFGLSVNQDASPYGSMGVVTSAYAGTAWGTYTFLFKASASGTSRFIVWMDNPASKILYFDTISIRQVSADYNDPLTNAAILVNSATSDQMMSCPDSQTNPGKCTQYAAFPDGTAVSWPVAVPAMGSKIVVWAANPYSDSDHDGVADAYDLCPGTTLGLTVDENGCSFAQQHSADLSLTMTDSPDPVLLNGTVTYNVTVTNNGPSSSSGIALTGLTGCTLPTTTLASGASTSCSAAVTATAVGTLSQTVSVTGAEPDLNTANNTATTTTTVNPVADLSVTLTDSPDPVLLNGTVTYTVTVTNNGPSPASGIALTGLTGCTLSSTTLAKGDAATCATSKTATSAGALTQSVTVSGTEYDPQTANNSASTTTNVQAVLTLSNGGTGTGTVTSSPAGINCGATCLAAYDANTAVTLTATHDVNTVVTWAGCTSAGDTCTVTMAASKTVTASFTALPDLTSPTAPTVSRSGGNLTINDSVKNQGAAAAGAFDISYYLSTDTTYQAGTDSFICKRSVTSLAAGASNPTTGTTATTCATPAVANGTYYVLAVDDSGNTVVESIETNNVRATGTTLSLGADLIPQSISVSKSGSTLTLKDSVKNQGTAPASGFTISFYLSVDKIYQAGTDYVICNRSVSSLGVGALNPSSGTTSSTCTVPSAAPSGKYYVLVVDDATNSVIESNETNNTLATSGTIAK